MPLTVFEVFWVLLFWVEKVWVLLVQQSLGNVISRARVLRLEFAGVGLVEWEKGCVRRCIVELEGVLSVMMGGNLVVVAVDVETGRSSAVIAVGVPVGVLDVEIAVEVEPEGEGSGSESGDSDLESKAVGSGAGVAENELAWDVHTAG
jgi:hypothetical protein